MPSGNSTVEGTPTGALSPLPGKTRQGTEWIAGTVYYGQHREMLSKNLREARSSPGHFRA